MNNNLVYISLILCILTSCDSKNKYRSLESGDNYIQENYLNFEKEQTEKSQEETMITCPACMGHGEGVFFDIYQICPVCKGDKIIPQKWIDEVNQQSMSAHIFDYSNDENSKDQRQNIEREISRLESVIQMAESGMENCSSEILIIQYKNQITEALYEIRRLQNILDNI